MMSGLAPGRDADTLIVGKSTCGSGDTGSIVNAAAPASATAIVSSVVATGRATKRREGFTRAVLGCDASRAAQPNCRRRCI